MAETEPEDGTLTGITLEEQPPFIPAGARCGCGHPVEAHHINLVTGDSTWCNECGHPAGCGRFRLAASQTATP
jgi:hypothetical protein